MTALVEALSVVVALLVILIASTRQRATQAPLPPARSEATFIAGLTGVWIHEGHTAAAQLDFARRNLESAGRPWPQNPWLDPVL